MRFWSLSRSLLAGVVAISFSDRMARSRFVAGIAVLNVSE